MRVREGEEWRERREGERMRDREERRKEMERGETDRWTNTEREKKSWSSGLSFRLLQ